MFRGHLFIRPQLTPFGAKVQYHITSCQLKVRFQKPESTLPCKISKEKEAQLEKYKHILLVIAQVVHMLGKQGLPFRGHTDNFKDIQNEKNNAGNFIEILKLMSIGDPILKEYLRAPTSRKTTFLSW